MKTGVLRCWRTGELWVWSREYVTKEKLNIEQATLNIEYRMQNRVACGLRVEENFPQRRKERRENLMEIN